MPASALQPARVASGNPAIAAKQIAYAFGRRWLLIFSLFGGVYVGLPWLAPVLMRAGWRGAGNAIYLAYSTQCHQLPQRSFFLFGPKPMYSLAEIQAAWRATDNPLILRQFVGNPRMGWKVAWSDRMVSLYTSIFLSGLLYGPLRKGLKPLPWWAFALLAAPMALDGGAHFISDFAGLGQGFRDTNHWLALLTANAFPPAFYAGDALGSFNSWMRLLTGLLFGLGAVGFAYPLLDRALAGAAGALEDQIHEAESLA